MRKLNKRNRAKQAVRRLPVLFYAVIFLVLIVLFFTNDFGVVDIHKTAVVSAVGIDVAPQGVKVTAQLAVPMPSQSGENIMHTPVQGTGPTFADALNDINSQTGFYPKLLFCRLIVLGESCQSVNIFDLLDWFYRDEYSSLTALVAMAEGEAGELLSTQTAFSDSTTLTMERILSEELKKSANVSTVNLKILGQQYHSPSASCYMPYIAKLGEQGEGNGGSGNGGSGNAGGQSPSGQSSQSQGSQSQGSSGQNQSSRQSEQGEQDGFYCRKTAAFTGGKFVGVLSEDQSMVLNLLKNNVKRAILSVHDEGSDYALGLRQNQKSTNVCVQNGKLLCTCRYQAVARIQNIQQSSSPQSQARSALVPQSVLKAASDKITAEMQTLLEFIKQTDCDLLGIKTEVYRKQNKYYNALQSNLFSHISFQVNVNLKSCT